MRFLKNIPKVAFSVISVFFSLMYFFSAYSFATEGDGPSLTIYMNDLALVRAQRKFSIKQGISDLKVTDIASRIDPTSVRFSPLKNISGLQLLEQNYEYDLVNAEQMLQKYIDQPIQITMVQGQFFEGKLLSALGDLVIEKKDNAIQTLSRTQVQNIAFPKLPEGLITRPTLVWKMKSAQLTECDAELSYLTAGLSWHSEYIAFLSSDEKSMDLSAWVSVENNSGVNYENARLQLMAGNPNRVENTQPVPLRAKFALAEMASDVQSFQEQSFFEYHLYTLPRLTTLKDRQTKQISLFPENKVAVKKKYRYESSKSKNVQVTLEWTNSKTEGLGFPLPSGKVRVFKSESEGRAQLLGEDRIQHTPKDEPVRFILGEAFDIVAERKVIEQKILSPQVRQETVEIELRNRKEEDVEVIVSEKRYGDWEIKSKIPFEKKDAQTVEFKIVVPKNKRMAIEYIAVTKS